MPREITTFSHDRGVEATPLQTYLMSLKGAPQARKYLGRERIIHDFSTLTSDARRGPARAKSAAPATAVLRGGSGGGVVLLRLLLGLLLRLLLGLLLRLLLRLLLMGLRLSCRDAESRATRPPSAPVDRPAHTAHPPRASGTRGW